MRARRNRVESLGTKRSRTATGLICRSYNGSRSSNECAVRAVKKDGWGRNVMAKYLITASYTAAGTKGLLAGGGGSARRKVVQDMMQGLGGSVEAFYYAFGEADVYAIIDAPDNVTAAAVSLAVNASGAVTTKTSPLLTVEEIDQAAKKTVRYRAPGQ